MFRSFFRGVLDFILPPLCISCEKPLEKQDEFICSRCFSTLVKFGSSHPWKDMYITEGIINDSFSLYRFVKDTPIQYLLHSLKYGKMKSVGTLLGKHIAANLPGGLQLDYSVPVPLHFAKARERTFNQSEYICCGISNVNGCGILPNLLKRKRFTISQTKLDKTEREENVKGAFGINQKQKAMIEGKNIILADDVITTGATILECARTLKDSGAAYVMICSAAYDALD